LIYVESQALIEPKKHEEGVEMKLIASEELRLKLLEEEFKLRSKQPTAWTKTKFRPYANFRRPKAEDEQVVAVTQ
jgi:hypothetical protein